MALLLALRSTIRTRHPKMQRNKKFKILEDDDEDYIPTGSSGSVQFPKPSTSNNSPALSKAKSAPLSSIASSSSSGAPLKKAKTGISAPKKRKHVAITSEDDSVLDTEAGGRPESGKEPKNWREVISLIEEAREGIVAPVDEVGAEALGDWDAVERGEIEPKVARFRTLLSLMLSSQTKDPVTANAMKNLNKRFAPLSVTTMLGASEADIDECINKVGFHNKKSVFIKETVAILHKRYNDDVPSTIAEITELPGVGPKMGFLLMQIAWKSIIGIAVDTHVHRITNRLGWVVSKTPEETRKKLESWLPREYWGTINQTIVGYGQAVCLPVGPKCQVCPVNHLCPSSTVSKEIEKL